MDSVSTPSESIDLSVSGEAESPPRDFAVFSRLMTGLFLVSLILAAGGLIGVGLYGASHANTIYEGVSIGGVDVGGMTRGEALAAIDEHFDTYMSEFVVLQSPDGSQEFAIDPASVGISIDREATVDRAFAYGREGSAWERSGVWASAFLSGSDVPAELTIDSATFQPTLESIAPELTRAPENAYLSMRDGETPEIVPELNGVGFDIAGTLEAIRTHIATSSSEPVLLRTVPVPAEITFDELELGLATAQEVVSSPVVVTGLDRGWGISESDLRQIVSIDPGSADLNVDAVAVTGFVQTIAEQMNRDAVDASLTVDENGILTSVPGTEGVVIDVEATTAVVIQAIATSTHDVALTYQLIAPQVSDQAAAAAAATGEEMMNRGVVIRWEGGEYRFDRSMLLESLTFRVNPESDSVFSFGFDRSVLSSYLTEVANQIEQPAVDAVLRYQDGKVTVASKSAKGRMLDYEATLDSVVNGALRGNGTATASFTKVNPIVTEQMATNISLDDVLAEASTFYGDSSDARRLNIENAVGLIDGWLVAPSAEYSYANSLGLVTEARGFVTGFGILDDPAGTGVITAPVVGGGICQVSTTIFQAAWWTGLPIVERYNHPYWIQTYGEPPRGMKGLDAMVNIEESGSLDLRFVNSTNEWIAVQVVTDGAVLTARILGVDPGWTVEVGAPIITDIAKPDRSINYLESPEMAPDTELQVEFAGEGFTAQVDRTVYDVNGTVIESGAVISTYAPSQNTILRGSGSAPLPTEEVPEASPAATPNS